MVLLVNGILKCVLKYGLFYSFILVSKSSFFFLVIVLIFIIHWYSSILCHYLLNKYARVGIICLRVSPVLSDKVGRQGSRQIGFIKTSAVTLKSTS